MKQSLKIIFILVAVLTSCKKDKYGNTDIKTNIHTVYTWTFEDPSYTCVINDADITQDVVDNGAVHVYMSNGGGGWVALPCTLPMSETYASTYTPVHFVGGVKIWQTDTDLLTLDPAQKTFKVIILSEHDMILHPNVDWTNYEEVETALHL